MRQDDAESDDTEWDDSGEADVTDILAFEEERVRSWKRRSNALLAALRRHHPELDPRRNEPKVVQRSDSERSARGESAGEPRGSGASEPSGALRKGACGNYERSMPAPPPQPMSEAAIRLADGLAEGDELHAPEQGLRGFEIARIKRAACRYYGFSLTELVSPRRQARLTRARQVAMYVAKVTTSRSFPEIGRHFGDRDHTTVLHAVKKIEADLDSYRDEIAAICEAVEARQS